MIDGGMRPSSTRTIRELWPSPVPSTRAFAVGPCRVIVGVEAGRWHLSISHPRRYPTWDEIREARYTLCPSGIDMVMHLPRVEDYVNLHPNTFHLWQILDVPRR